MDGGSGRQSFNALGECLERENVNGVLGINWRFKQDREREEPTIEPEYGVRDGYFRGWGVLRGGWGATDIRAAENMKSRFRMIET